MDNLVYETLTLPPCIPLVGTAIVGNKRFPENMAKANAQGTSKAGALKVPTGSGVGGGNRSGAIPAFMESIFLELAIPWEEAISLAPTAPQLIYCPVTHPLAL